MAIKTVGVLGCGLMGAGVAQVSAAALFVLVFPGNLQMAWDARDDTALRQVATVARLPIQVVLIWWALRVAKAAKPRPTTSAPVSET